MVVRADGPPQRQASGSCPAHFDGGRAMKKPPRLLIEEWLPAAAIGVECIRERSTGQQPPDKRFHVWWARRPLVASRAAVLASLLPADFPRDVFERLLGFGRSIDVQVCFRNLRSLLECEIALFAVK